MKIKRIVAMVLLVGILCSFAVPVTYATEEATVPTVVEPTEVWEETTEPWEETTAPWEETTEPWEEEVTVSAEPIVLLQMDGTENRNNDGFVTIDPTLYPESDHNYKENLNETKTFTVPGAKELMITFSDSTATEYNFDRIYICDGDGNQIASYTGTEAAGVTLTIPGNTFTVTLTSDYSVQHYGYSFSSIAAKIATLSEISVKCQPAKVAYWQGEPLNLNGLLLTATYLEGFTEEISSGYTVSGYDSSIPGEQTLTVTYEDKTTTFNVTVDQHSLAGIVINTLPAKTVYNLRENLDITGLTLTAVCDDGNNQMVEECFTVSGYDNNKIGVQVITVAYGDCTASFEIVVTYSGSWGSNLYWSLDGEGTLTISGTGSMYWEIPWLDHKSYVKEVIIEEGVTSVGAYTFEYCENLKRVVIPNTVTAIRECAFLGCANLESINIPSSVIGIQMSAFKGCNRLTGFWVDENNSYFSSDSAGVLFNKGKTELIQAPRTLNGAYVVPDGVTSIVEGAFNGCTAMTSLEIADSVTLVDCYAFYGCTALKSVKLPAGITSIDDYVFGGCASLTDIEIPDSVKKISEYSFAGCSSLKNVKIPDGVTSIGYKAFCGCTSLVDMGIPDSVTQIECSAFSNCTSLKNVTIPEGVTNIVYATFAGCTALENIEIPESVTAIEQYAFSDCTGLETITIPDGVTSIYEYAFCGCASLTDINIGSGVDDFCKYALLNCPSLAGIWVDADNEYFSNDDSGVLFNKDKTYLYYAPSAIKKAYQIPDTVTFIEYEAFYNNTALTAITIPESVTTVDNYAFTGCTSLTDVYYTGTQDQWMLISIFAGNEALTTANIHYKWKELAGLALATPSLKTEYWAGEELDTTGLTLTATYVDGSTGDIFDGFTISGFDSTTAGTKTVTITYMDFTVTFDVTVTYGGVCGEELTWAFDDNILTVSGTGAMDDWSEGAAPWNSHSNTIKQVVLEEGITAIGNWAFSACNSLNTVVYCGTQEQWDTMAIGNQGNDPLLKATLQLHKYEKGTCIYCAHICEYTVTFKNWNGDVLSTKTYHYGDKVIAPADPTREPGNDCVYNFNGWDQKITTCDGNKVYTATYKSAKFTDVSSNSWQNAPVAYVYSRKLMAGKGTDKDGNIKFDPNSFITREEFVQVLYNAEGKPSVSIANNFPDVGEKAWFKNAVLWANQNNIANGMGNGNFGVGKNITRQDLAMMLYKYAKLKNVPISINDGEIFKYADGNKVSGYAREAMNWAVTNGVLSGKGVKGDPLSKFKLDPAGTATRAECAAMLKNFMTAFGL